MNSGSLKANGQNNCPGEKSVPFEEVGLPAVDQSRSDRPRSPVAFLLSLRLYGKRLRASESKHGRNGVPSSGQVGLSDADHSQHRNCKLYLELRASLKYHDQINLNVRILPISTHISENKNKSASLKVSDIKFQIITIKDDSKV